MKNEPMLRFMNYWKQVNIAREMIKPGETVLEIGPGEKVFSNFLKTNWNINVVTLDCDPGKSPDILTDVRHWNNEDSYNAVFAFQVFEHIPYHDFKRIISKLWTDNLFFSVPYRSERLWWSYNWIPYFKYLNFEINIPRPGIRWYAHQWEVTSTRKLLDDVKGCGWEILSSEKFTNRLFVKCKR